MDRYVSGERIHSASEKRTQGDILVKYYHPFGFGSLNNCDFHSRVFPYCD
jgi:hypothetical protein